MADRLGNQGMLRYAAGLRAQLAPWRISSPGDVAEREADVMAERALSNATPTVPSAEAAGVQRQATSSSAPSAPASAFAPGLGVGRPLDPQSRTYFEPRFGANFSGVRIHDDQVAHRAADGLSAKAFTVGQNIAFARGLHAPDTEEGRRLLAHELAHVAQTQTSKLSAQTIYRKAKTEADYRPERNFSEPSLELVEASQSRERWRLSHFDVASFDVQQPGVAYSLAALVEHVLKKKACYRCQVSITGFTSKSVVSKVNAGELAENRAFAVGEYFKEHAIEVAHVDLQAPSAATSEYASPETKAADRGVEIVVEYLRLPAGAGDLTTEYCQALTVAAEHPGQPPAPFSLGDAFRYAKDRSTIWAHKNNFVSSMRETIQASAQQYDLPPELIAGVAYNEYGGTDPIKLEVYRLRQVTDWAGDPEKTSIPPMSLQVRRAVESLGYDGVSPGMKESIVQSLQQPAAAIAIASKHLSDLRDREFPGKHAQDLTSLQVVIQTQSYNGIEILGARYNAGPDKPTANLGPLALDYGKKIWARWAFFASLLR